MEAIYNLVQKGMPDEDLGKYTRILTDQLIELFIIEVENLEKEGVQPSSRRIKEVLKFKLTR